MDDKRKLQKNMKKKKSEKSCGVHARFMRRVLFRTVGSLKETGTGNGTGTGTGTGNGQELRIQARGLAEIDDRRGNQTLHFVPEARWRILCILYNVLYDLI